MATDLSDVPSLVVLKILLLLPVDARGIACCVRRAWRDALKSPALWTRLDLSVTSGVTCTINRKVFRALSARARGDSLNPGQGLETLDVTGRSDMLHTLREVVANNAATLRELRTLDSSLLDADCEETASDEEFPTDFGKVLKEVISLAPALQVVAVDVWGDYSLVRPMLRNESPFRPLRLGELCFIFDAITADVPAFVADMSAHPSLSRLGLISSNSNPALFSFSVSPLSAALLELVIEAALTRRVSSFFFYGCRPTPTVAPALSSLLRSSALTDLLLSSDGPPSGITGVSTEAMLDTSAAALLSAAVRSSRTLQKLVLQNVGLWNDAEAAVMLLSALTGHASLHVLDCSRNCVHPSAAATIGAALGALVAANSPAFEELAVDYCELGDAGLHPMVDALRRNTHLRALTLTGNNISNALAEEQLVPAVRANTSLLKLVAGLQHYDRENAPIAAIDEAMHVVSERCLAREAAEHEQQLVWRARMAAALRGQAAPEAATSDSE